MLRIVMFAAFVGGAALIVPPLIERSFENADRRAVVETATPAPQPSRLSSSGGRKVVLEADARGHFQGTFKINGRRVEGLIDTGASVIAINRSTARKLGLSVSPADFTTQVRTANGTVKAAHVVLRRVEIQSIRVDNVDAFVLDDTSLSGTLIGMSFLKKLRSYQAVDGRMVLKAR